MGDSAGGHLAALLALDDATRGRVRAVVGVYGVYDLLDLTVWWSDPGRGLQGDPARELLGGTPTERPAAYAAASPLGQARAFAAALRDLRAPVETAAVPDYGHFWFTLQDEYPGRDVTEEPNASLAPRLLRFLQAHV